MAVPSVALVGGAGFIGSNLTHCLQARGWRVAVYDKPGCESFLPGQTVHPLDIADPDADFDPLLGYDAVVLLAALLGKECEARPQDAWSVNVGGSTRLLGFLQSRAAPGPRRRLVFLSSGAIYDPVFATSPYSERAPTAGSSLYTATKISIENAVRTAVRSGSLDALILRPFTVFGPLGMRGSVGHFLGRWLELAMAGKPLTVHGAGDHGVDLVWIDEVTEAIADYIGRHVVEPLTILNVSSGTTIAVREVAAMFADIFDGVAVESIPPPPVLSSHGCGDVTAFVRYFDRPVASSRATLRRFLESARGSLKSGSR